jgi:hypothetical protein
MTELVIGSTPRGEDYFGQEDLIEILWSRLKKGNVLLVAPRRFGKTAAMYMLLDFPRQPFIPIYIDVEYMNSAADFMVELVAKLIKQHHFLWVAKSIWEETREFGKFLRNLPSTIDFGGLKVEIREKTDVSQKWLAYGERITSLLAKEGKPLLLIIDEFPIMVNYILDRDPEEARQLLHWFRSARLAPDTRTRFVIGGSINLESTLDHHGLVDTINDMAVIKLFPFTQETARRFIKEIFASRDTKLTAKVKETIMELVGVPIPFLLAVLLTAIVDRARILNCKVTPQVVKDAFDEDLLSGSTSATFQHYRSRIDQYYPDLEGRAARTILATLSRADKPVKRDTLYQIYLKTGNLTPDIESREGFMRLMNKLDNDFYLGVTDDTYTFYSRVLQLWWKTHYGWELEK